MSGSSASSFDPVSVVVVCYNAVQTIHRCLVSLLAQDYAADYELLVVDNGSTDGTLGVIQRLAQEHPRLRYILNPIRGIAVSRNLGWQQARYALVAYTDADCQVPRSWLTLLVSGLQTWSVVRPNLAAVGGSNIPPEEDSRFYRALSLFLNSYLGSHGSVQGMRYPCDQEVPHLPTVNVLYKKSALQQVNGFDAGFYNIGEDRDLSYRLQHAGFIFYYLAKSTVTHRMRSNLRSWFQNMFVYGKGRMWLMRRHPQNLDWILLLPMMLVVAFLAIPFIRWPACLYLVSMLAYSLLVIGRIRQLGLVMPLFCLFVGTHLTYGLGQWYGLVKKRSRL